MAASGYTEIQLYHSSTSGVAPSAGNLVDGELALNSFDGKLYYKNTSGVVTLLASAAGAVAATNLFGGTSGQIPVQVGVSTTGFITAPGTSGTFLGWNGSGFSWSSGTGVSGYSGYSGTGISGYSGFSGYSGINGVGVSGYSGISGYSGTNGTGTSGYSGYSGAAATSTANILGGTTGSIVYQSSTDNTTFLTNQNGKVLVGGASAPTFIAQSGLAAGSAINLSGGNANQVVFQSATGVTSYANAPTSGSTANPGFLGWDGTAFVWNRWLTFLTSSNINGALGYTAAAANGSNASGTWTINITGSAGSASTAGSLYNGTSGWSVTPSGTKLYFSYNGTNVGSLDSSGNFIALASVTGNGTP
jgi:hypothetical protein